jgi:signal transduction histidine kinase/DNA-binding response OmpR family regulator/ligand-binding sensor domain-containing protein
LLFEFVAVNAQYQIISETYSVENGLSQNLVTDMLKDDDGFLWFATKDGLSRFDGYNFKNYKVSSIELKSSVSNQFQQLLKDDYGFFWIVNSVGQVFRFDPRTERFELYPPANENRGKNYISVKQLIKTASGEIWMPGYSNGCIRAVTDTSDFSVKLTFFCTQNQQKTGTEVRSIYQDKDFRMWILTDHGMAVISQGEDEPSGHYLTEREDAERQNSLFAAIETNEELLVSGSEGRLFRYNKSKKRFTVFQLPVMSNLNNILALGDSVCFVSTDSDGFFLLNYRTDKFRRFLSARTKGMRSDAIENSWKDTRGDVWMKLAGTFGFMRYNPAQDKLYYMPFRYYLEDFSSFPLTESSPFLLSFKDDKDKIWLMPSERKNAWYNDDYTKSKPKFNHENSKELFPSVVYKSLSDTAGVFWQTTHYEGIQKCVSLNSSFRFTQCKNSPEYSEANDILALFEDDRQRLWISTRDNRVRIYDKDRQFLGFLNKTGEITRTDTGFAGVLSIYQDRKGIFWIGGNPGLFKLTPKSRDAGAFSVQSYHTSKNGEFSPISLIINDILEDSRGRIWMTTLDGGLQLLDETDGEARFIHKNNSFKNNYPPAVLLTKCLFEDTNGNIWVGSSEGITVFSNEFDRPEHIKFFFYNSENTDLANSSISDIYQERDGIIWFTSFGGGLFHISTAFYLGETPDFISYNRENKRFPSDLALSIQEDNQGFMWVVTEDAIVKFDKKNATAEVFGKISGLDQAGFSERAIIKRQSGEFIVGTASGFYSFYPERIIRTEYQPNIVFTRFLLFNKEVELGGNDSPLQTTISTTDEITLTHKQSVFSIEYAALDYRNPSHIQYAYKLDNFEENWNYVGTQRMVSYTNLPKGTYYFRVKSTNSEGTWFDNDRVLKITVLPSFWETGLAYFLYVLMVLLVIGTIITVFIVFYRLRSRMKLDRDMSAMKLQFFTDVSHELRTPLTLINAPLENVLENGSLSKQDREQLEVVHTNTNRMLRMMNQILDFRKIQSNKMRLRVEKTRLGEFIVACSENFRKIAENRNIDFRVEDHTNGAFFWVDRDKIDTLMFNLLSNAFKFTESGKSIAVSVSLENGEAVVRVKDEGCGIPKDKLPVIFDRFTSINLSLTKQTGTGIGLSLVKEIADLHKAAISVSSEEGAGTVFEVRFKPGVGHLDESSDVIICDEELPEENKGMENSSSEKNREIPTLLVIEDNEDLRSFLVSVLSKKFNIIEAPNGKTGWERTLQEMPDFVITDIMMPEMDGITYTRRVRENERTSHIPIILLTAKTDMESKLECLKIGANDYITKPFSMAYLETRVENILEERKKWQDKYRNSLLQPKSSIQGNTAEPPVSKPETQDDVLMRKLVDYIEKHMDNSNLTLDDVLDELKMSRWHLTTKIKALVGLTPNEFIRETRLSRAAKLIEEGEYNMTQITYMIGMTDSRYFSRSFKQKFGVTPTEYKNAKR